MQKTLTRRGFLQGCSLGIAALAGARFTHAAYAAQPPDSGTLVVVFLRGGWDALNVAPPLDGEDRILYEQARPGIKIPQASLLALDERFGLHPALAPLHELYQDGKMGLVHAVGLNYDTRSHFDAMEFIELGTPGVKTTTNGWLTRHLLSSQGYDLAARIPIAASPETPTALLNETRSVSMSRLEDLSQWDNGHLADQQTALRRLYAGDDALRQTGLRTLEVVQTIAPTLENSYQPAAGAAYSDDEFSGQMRAIAQLIKMDAGLQVATVDLGGWDTHQDQNDGTGGYMGNLLASLGSGLAAFINDLENGYANQVSVVVLSEFGRRLAQNDSRGTDHGHGSVMLALGAGVNGGRVYGNWPGLANHQLYDRADLAVTTDFREVLSELLLKRLANPNLEAIFPGYAYQDGIGVFQGGLTG